MKRDFFSLWVQLVLVFVALIVVQGALRKWMFPQFSTYLYVAKDIVLLACLALFAQEHRVRLPLPVSQSLFPAIWGIFCFVVLVQAFNFNVPSIGASVIGVRSYLLYSVLLFILPVILEQLSERRSTLKWMMIVGITPVLLLGWYQYFQPVDSWINQYVASDAKAASVLSRARITGTFSYIGGMSAFLVFSLFTATGALLAGLKHNYRPYQIVGGALLALALVVAPMNGSRSVVLGGLIPLPFLLVSILRERGKSHALTGLIILLSIGGLVYSQTDVFTQGWETIEHRLENASDRDTRVQSMLLDPIRKIPVGSIFGYGSGSTHQAATAVSEQGKISIEGIGYEGELGRVIIELGVFGALLFLALKAWLSWISWKALLRSRSVVETFLGATSFCMLFLNLVAGEKIVFNHVNSALYWICAGCVIWVWSRQELRIRHQRQPVTHA
jgi:hypothetical protein